MSIKKLLEKVAVGATVGALVIAGAVVSVNAQRNPYLTNSPQNAAEDVKAGSAELPILFNVDLRAVLYAVPNPGTDGFTVGLDTISTGGLLAPTGPGNMANVGWLFVETNYSAWDILVNRENGGFLVRDPKDGETPDTLGGIDVETCVDVPGPFGSTTQDCSTERVGGRIGKALKYKYNDGTDDIIGPCSVEVAIGVIDTGALKTAASIMTEIKKNTRAIANLTSPLLFQKDTGTTPAPAYYDYASIAFSLGEGATSVAASGYFAGTTGVGDKPWTGTLPVLATTGDRYFPQITGGPELRLDSEIGDPYTTVPAPGLRDKSIVFFVNARLGINGTDAMLIGNRNGTYSENLVFTFYGLY